MIPLTNQQAAELRSWFLPEEPGPVIGMHVINTGCGQFMANRLPEPTAVLIQAGGNYALAGRPNDLTPADLCGRITGMVAADQAFRPLLAETFPGLLIWPRVILTHNGALPATAPGGLRLQRLDPDDAPLLNTLDRENWWISNTWGGHRRLARSGMAWAVLDGERVVSVACSFFVGQDFEDIGVVTEAEYRGRGLSGACAAALCADIYNRGRRPSWSTSTDNLPSLRAAEKLGFRVQREEVLYVIGTDIPEPARI